MNRSYPIVHLCKCVSGRRVFFECGCSASLPRDTSFYHVDDISLVTCLKCLSTLKGIRLLGGAA